MPVAKPLAPAPFFALALLGLGLLLGLTARAPKARTLEQTVRASRWKKRVLLIAAPAADQADFRAQKQLLASSKAELAARDLLVIEVLYPQLSAADRQFLTQKTGIQPPRFAAVLLGKDGGVKMRSAHPIAPAALFRTIDQMPMRRQEMRRGAGEPE
ncbi:DUF4174 domain-containing protein [Hymenobacter sp.]|uniref:DUF4174 domain-containing protein n=1 Tax=Hymenobacter sp. TaxID=1898978 RepID=UPI00286CA400|nr:DUF4174 domain-containing protein [Hymenobacter sp.]